MNGQNTNTAAPAPATIIPPNGTAQIRVEGAALHRMSTKQLYALGVALESVSELLAGLSCQPRFNDDVGLNVAGDVLADLMEFISTYRESIRNMALARVPTDADAVEWRWWAVLHYEVALADDLAALGVLVSQAIKAHGSAKFADEHAARTANG